MFQGGFSEGCWEREWCEGRFSGLALPRGKEQAAAPLGEKASWGSGPAHSWQPFAELCRECCLIDWPVALGQKVLALTLSPHKVGIVSRFRNKNPRCPIKFQIKYEYFKNTGISPVLLGMYLRLKKKLSIVYLKVTFNWVSCILLATLDVGTWEGCGLRGGGSAKPALKGPADRTSCIWRKPSLMRVWVLLVLGHFYVHRTPVLSLSWKSSENNFN